MFNIGYFENLYPCGLVIYFAIDLTIVLTFSKTLLIQGEKVAVLFFAKLCFS